VQVNILEEYPAAKLRVYAFWYPVLPSDSRQAWFDNDQTVITDPRVINLWGNAQIAAGWLGESGVQYTAAMTFDTYYLYGPKAAWQANAVAPSSALSSGSTIIARSGELKRNLLAILPGP
jgi:hypothetical protein